MSTARAGRKALKEQHWLRIWTLFDKRKFDRLEEQVDKLHQRGFDLAAVPFRLLDRAFSEEQTAPLNGLDRLARFTAGGQPRLLSAIVDACVTNDNSPLDRIVADEEAHRMTRFEAMSWAVFLANAGSLPNVPRQPHQVFQFWDSNALPPEISGAVERWQCIAADHVLYDEGMAADYIRAHFGGDAAREFTALWHPAVKSDLFRLYRLARDGGLYCDADSVPQAFSERFTRTCGDQTWIFAMTDRPNCAACNGWMAAPAGSDFVAGYLERVLLNLRERPVDNIFWLSGPGALTLHLYRQPTEVAVVPVGTLKRDLFRQVDAEYKRTDAGWRVYEGKRGMTNAPGLKMALAEIQQAEA